jgi:endonuclease YncB( thermonuclease family)
MSQRIFLHPDGTEFKEPQEGYYKLDTKRINKRINDETEQIEGYNIIGSREMIFLFCLKNGIDAPNFKHNLSFTKADTIESITDEEVSSISRFSLQNFKGKVKVTDIIDGDTVEVLIYFPLINLVQPRDIVKNNVHKLGSSGLIKEKDKNSGFFTKFLVRLNGLDAFEKQTDKGKAAKEALKTKLSEFGMYCFMEAEGFEKYGRVLATLYEPHLTRSGELVRKVSINQFLMNYKHPVHGSVAYAYSGGTKSDEAKLEVEKVRRKSQVKEEKKPGCVIF